MCASSLAICLNRFLPVASLKARRMGQVVVD